MEGPVHKYMKSSPGCWAIYGEILAKEYSDRSFFDIHRLTVDAYAVQHPGGRDRQSIQSVGVHLIRLYFFLECSLSPERANTSMLEAGKRKKEFTWLAPRKCMGNITAADIHKASSMEEHKELVFMWAREVWNAWAEHHQTIYNWAPDNFLGKQT